TRKGTGRSACRSASSSASPLHGCCSRARSSSFSTRQPRHWTRPRKCRSTASYGRHPGDRRLSASVTTEPCTAYTIRSSILAAIRFLGRLSDDRVWAGRVATEIQMSHPEDPLRAVRMDKLESLKAQGIDPYPYGFDRTHEAAELERLYSGLAAGAETGERV